jgi:hypothetical protein
LLRNFIHLEKNVSEGVSISLLLLVVWKIVRWPVVVFRIRKLIREKELISIAILTEPVE